MLSSGDLYLIIVGVFTWDETMFPVLVALSDLKDTASLQLCFQAMKDRAPGAFLALSLTSTDTGLCFLL
jgi:hypothetical protein